MNQLKRCCWVDSCTQKYHDEEWGVPVHDDGLLFEMLLLESFQAGLSWVIILKKREGFRKAFAGFDAKAIAGFSEEKVQQLLGDDGIVKSRSKILATIRNAQIYLDIQKEYGSFSGYLWAFTGNRIIRNNGDALPESEKDLPERLSKDLKKRGMKFMGPTTVYAFLQAVGVVNNHEAGCFRSGT